MRSSLIRSLQVCLSLSLAACGGNVETTDGDVGGGGGSSTSTSEGGAGGGETTSSSSPTSSSSTTPSTTTPSTTTSTSEGGGGAGGGPVEGCAALAPIQLSSPGVIGPDGDPSWGPGESASVFVTMTNTTFADIDYPGIVMTSDSDLVKPDGTGYSAFFLIFGAETKPIDVPFTADPATPPGTVVKITATLMDIQANVCEELESLSFDVTIQ